MSISVAVPVANPLIYQSFDYGGLRFFPAGHPFGFGEAESGSEPLPSVPSADVWFLSDGASSGNLSRAISECTGVYPADFLNASVVTFDMEVADFDFLAQSESMTSACSAGACSHGEDN